LRSGCSGLAFVPSHPLRTGRTLEPCRSFWARRSWRALHTCLSPRARFPEGTLWPNRALGACYSLRPRRSLCPGGASRCDFSFFALWPLSTCWTLRPSLALGARNPLRAGWPCGAYSPTFRFRTACK